MLDQTPLALFAKRCNLPVRKGLDNRLRVFSDSPDTMPPISCLLHGCEKCFFTNLSEFVAHCDAEREGYHTYRFLDALGFATMLAKIIVTCECHVSCIFEPC